MRSILLPAVLIISLAVVGCDGSVRGFFTGLPPDVQVTADPKFKVTKAKSVAVVVLVPYAYHDRGGLAQQLNDEVEAALVAKGYSLAAGRLSAQAVNVRPDQVDPAALAKDTGASLVLCINVTTLNFVYAPASGSQPDCNFAATAKGIDVATGRSGWMASASGTANLVSSTTAEQVASQVVAALVAPFPAKNAPGSDSVAAPTGP